MQTMATIMSTPPVATCIAFDPKDNNVIAIGMEDATVQIYHVRLDEVSYYCVAEFCEKFIVDGKS